MINHPSSYSSEVNSEAAIMTNKMVIQQPRAFAQTMTSNQWSSEICDCTDDMSMCCFAFWCFPCFTCITAKEFGECLCLPLLDYFGMNVSLAMRSTMRQRYGIEGTMCKDCACSFFCLPCSWCQMKREMKIRNQPITLIHANRA
ncbi:hypothetical protein UPYG_G00239250 [Umbra pygmaea]|uniref:Uncharacterized protein n=1 Tax=Umbra pygmaea TaxID=75934 RepID=A0ABD0WFS5_UMBPY